MKLFWRPSRARLCVARWLVAKRGTTPTDAPMCRPSAVASSCGERSSRAGIRQLVAPKRRHVETEVAENVEGLVEALVGVALVRERPDEDAPLLEDLRLEVVAHAVDVRAVVLREVRLLERGVELDERGADPRVERFDVSAHRRVDRRPSAERTDELHVSTLPLPFTSTKPRVP